MYVQKLRLKKGWSQQQLADFSGLSVRTVQRIEAGHAPSTESLKSLAAVFEVDFTTLTPEPPMPDTNPTYLEERAAFEYVRKLRRFYDGLLMFLLIIPLLWGLNWYSSSSYWWAVWPTLGWGLALRAYGVFGRSQFFGPQWERRQVEKRLGRSL